MMKLHLIVKRFRSHRILLFINPDLSSKKIQLFGNISVNTEAYSIHFNYQFL